jgi:hypothetical protein
MESKRLGIWIACAITAGVSVVFVFPVDWFMPVFLCSIAATLLCGVIARLSVKDDRPVNPVVEVAAAVLSLPSRPRANVPSSLALQCFLVFAAFVVALALSVVVRANV